MSQQGIMTEFRIRNSNVAISMSGVEVEIASDQLIYRKGGDQLSLRIDCAAGYHNSWIAKAKVYLPDILRWRAGWRLSGWEAALLRSEISDALLTFQLEAEFEREENVELVRLKHPSSA